MSCVCVLACRANKIQEYIFGSGVCDNVRVVKACLGWGRYACPCCWVVSRVSRKNLVTTHSTSAWPLTLSHAFSPARATTGVDKLSFCKQRLQAVHRHREQQGRLYSRSVVHLSFYNLHTEASNSSVTSSPSSPGRQGSEGGSKSPVFVWRYSTPSRELLRTRTQQTHCCAPLWGRRVTAGAVLLWRRYVMFSCCQQLSDCSENSVNFNNTWGRRLSSNMY